MRSCGPRGNRRTWTSSMTPGRPLRPAGTATASCFWGKLAFEGAAPDAGALSREWGGMVREASTVVDALPVETLGTCVLGQDGALFRGAAVDLEKALAEG